MGWVTLYYLFIVCHAHTLKMLAEQITSGYAITFAGFMNLRNIISHLILIRHNHVYLSFKKKWQMMAGEGRGHVHMKRLLNF